MSTYLGTQEPGPVMGQFHSVGRFIVPTKGLVFVLERPTRPLDVSWNLNRLRACDNL